MEHQHQDNQGLSADLRHANSGNPTPMLNSQKAKNISPSFNRFMYGAFIVLSAYFAITGQWATAAANLGIGLIFDPFDQKIKWQDRPFYQRALLIIHLSIVLILFALEFAGKI